MKILDPKRVFKVIAVLCAIGTIAGFLGRFWWVIDLTSHFRVQYALVLCICTVIYMRTKRWPLAIAAMVLSLINIAVIAPLYISLENAGNKQNTGEKIRIVLVNVFTPNTAYDKVIAFIKKEDPDLIALLEVSPVWIEKLFPLEQSYPYRAAFPQNDNFGIALYSKVKPISMKRIDFGGVPLANILARFKFGSRIINVAVTHLLPPTKTYYAHASTIMTKGIVETLRDAIGAKIIIGDLNATPWGETYKQLTEGLRLRNGRKGYGIQTTWPSWLPMFWIPIDHCLISDDLTVLDHRLGPYVGSDHIPLVVDLALKQ